MRTSATLCAAVLLVLLHGSLAAVTATGATFEDFKKLYKRTYANAAEEARRHTIFQENMAIAERLQALNPLATFGMTPYADLSPAEFQVYHDGAAHFRAAAAKSGAPPPLYTKEQLQAGSIDWRTKGAVTYVKNQGQCGSCWSFSATGNIEGQWFLAGNKLVAVSEQELVSCDTTDDGCQGGLMDNAFSWLVSSRGGKIATEASYPYVSGSGSVPSCQMSGKVTGAVISGHQDLPHNEDQMATWMLTHGPIAIGVDATSWQTYSGGIMTNCISSRVDHGVLAVGFDDNNNPPYWIIKNSWGGSWGESGYIRVKKGTDQCLLTSAPSSSIVSGGPTPPAPPTPPSPPTPSPPAPPTPGGDFTQYVCDNWLCTDNCQSHTFPQKKCLRTAEGSSVIATCGSGALTLRVYSSADCTGSSKTEEEPLNMCLQDESGTYVYNTCPSLQKDNAAVASNSRRGTLLRRSRA